MAAEAAAGAIAKVAANESSQLELFQKLHLVPNGFDAVVNALLANPNVTSLNIGNDGIGADTTPDQWTAFCSALQKLSKLQGLDLGFNYLNDGHLNQLVTALLASGAPLSLLSLRQNEGASSAALVDAAARLKTIPTLNTLNFISCGLNDESALAVARSATECKSMARLDLYGNRLSAEGVQRIIEVVTTGSIRALSVRNPSISEQQWQGLVQQAAAVQPPLALE